ncbi:hypothetical protein BBJ28_00015771 [Nothophytophthora sp. Chile5]|nr:hypothetical protein BBJ28_00015771 [Nothophytophthora sp. Chile5]
MENKMAQHQIDSAATPASSDNIPYSVQIDVPVDSSCQPVEQATKTLDDESEFTVGSWEVGFFDCFRDLVPNCFMVTFCPCISMAQISAKLGVYSYMNTLMACLVVIVAEYVVFGLAMNTSSTTYAVDTDYDENGYPSYQYTISENYTAVTVYRLIAVIVRVAFAVFVCHLRMKIRERFQIPGNNYTDCCAAFMCSCCTLAQMATHVKSYKAGSCDFGAPADTLPAYR